MFEIDKKSFGEFICILRKEKSMTQKDLACRLLVSDKAVSKWETGNSMPDILSDVVGRTGEYVLIAIWIAGLFVPMHVVAKKYE